jgi:hypothetical protein
MRDYAKIVEAARIHYENLKTDIANAHNRIEHIRLTALAQEAHNLYTDLLAFDIGLVYSHTGSTEDYFNRTVDKNKIEVPEFKSPYIPPTS